MTFFFLIFILSMRHEWWWKIMPFLYTGDFVNLKIVISLQTVDFLLYSHLYFIELTAALVCGYLPPCPMVSLSTISWVKIIVHIWGGESRSTMIGKWVLRRQTKMSRHVQSVLCLLFPIMKVNIYLLSSVLYTYSMELVLICPSFSHTFCRVWRVYYSRLRQWQKLTLSRIWKCE